MESCIAFANINDFIFCPASIYFHGMYDGIEGLLYKAAPQINGTSAHRRVDEGTTFSGKVISGIAVYSSKYDIEGKIDRYFVDKHYLVEYKNRIETIYDGYVFQLYAQYFGMLEAGYEVKKLFLHSLQNNKRYEIPLPENNQEMLIKFEKTLSDMREFSLDSFSQENRTKCENCIYANICKWGV